LGLCFISPAKELDGGGKQPDAIFFEIKIGMQHKRSGTPTRRSDNGGQFWRESLDNQDQGQMNGAHNGW